tara:strand:+ start:323 stop:1090 length:768 start_codon:yes stop_codon:yes gene_type:complete
MKITKEQIKETLKLVMNEEADYKVFFKKALEKAGKSIPSMSDDEKKAFFNKIDAAWDAKSEVKEGNAFGAAVVAAKEAGEDEFEVDGEKFKVEESHSDCGCGCGGVTEGGCNTKSVNEASKEAMGIAALTGTRGSAVEDFILKHELDGKKLFKSITKANLRGRLNFVSALAGKDGNPNQKLTIKLHKENFNEELSTELAFEVITFMERPVMETVMVDAFEKSDIVEMLVNEGINDVLTEGVKAEFNTLVETYNKK